MSRSFNIGDAITKAVGVLFGTKASDPTQAETVDVRDGFASVASPGEIPGVGVTREIANPTTTPVTKDFPSGLLSVTIGYLDSGSAAGKLLYAVFDALDADDAATKLGAEGREVVKIEGFRTFVFSPSTPCYRVSVASNVASETGSSLVLLSGKVPA